MGCPVGQMCHKSPSSTFDEKRNMFTSLFHSWNFNRTLRLVLAGFAAYQAWEISDPFLGVMAGLLGLMALTNTGCCGAGGCNLPPK
jgi:hypothetical protein